MATINDFKGTINKGTINKGTVNGGIEWLDVSGADMIIGIISADVMLRVKVSTAKGMPFSKILSFKATTTADIDNGTVKCTDITYIVYQAKLEKDSRVFTAVLVHSCYAGDFSEIQQPKYITDKLNIAWARHQAIIKHEKEEQAKLHEEEARIDKLWLDIITYLPVGDEVSYLRHIFDNVAESANEKNVRNGLFLLQKEKETAIWKGLELLGIEKVDRERLKQPQVSRKIYDYIIVKANRLYPEFKDPREDEFYGNASQMKAVSQPKAASQPEVTTKPEEESQPKAASQPEATTKPEEESQPKAASQPEATTQQEDDIIDIIRIATGQIEFPMTWLLTIKHLDVEKAVRILLRAEELESLMRGNDLGAAAIKDPHFIEGLSLILSLK